MPAGTKEFGAICDDPDAPRTDPWVHWVIYKIPADAKGLPEGVERKPQSQGPGGGDPRRKTPGDDDTSATAARCRRPATVYTTIISSSLPSTRELSVSPGLDKKAILDAIRGHVLADGVLMGTYERKKK